MSYAVIVSRIAASTRVLLE